MRRSATALGLLVALGAFALGGSTQEASGSPSAKSSPDAPVNTFTSAGLTDKQFCDVVGNKEIQAAALGLLGFFAKKKISTTSIYTTAALTSINLLCRPVMKRAIPAISRFLGLAPRPKRTPSQSDFASSFGSATAQGVSERLKRIGWNYNAATVDRITGELCFVVRQGQSPRPTFRKWFVNARFESLTALNGLVAYARTCRPALKPLQLVYLTSSITGYLTDNAYARDYSPPVTTLYTPTETLLANGNVQVNLRWSSYDFGGRVVEQALFIGTNGRWHALSRGVAYVTRGQPYNIATRARDASGNWSSWIFTPVYTARRS